MRMRVDEAGRDDEAGGVDRLAGVRNVPADSPFQNVENLVTVNKNVADERFRRRLSRF